MEVFLLKTDMPMAPRKYTLSALHLITELVQHLVAAARFVVDVAFGDDDDDDRDCTANKT